MPIPIRLSTAAIAATIAACSPPATETAEPNVAQTPTVATRVDPAPPPSPSPTATTPSAAEDAVVANLAITADNYARVMEARSREYDRLEYKPVALNGFECGDNCYLELTAPLEGAAPVKVLCTARLCGDWRDTGALPASLRDTGARVKFGTADQVDGAGAVMKRGVRAVVDLRQPEARRGAARATGGGALPLARGVYVQQGVGCASPPNASFRVWNGRGLSGSATRACRPTVLSRRGDTYTVSNDCEETYDGSRTAERQVIVIPDDTRFILDGRSYRRCAPGEAPAMLEKLTR